MALPLRVPVVCVFRMQLYAMVSETLRYKPLLDRLVVKADPKWVFLAHDA